MAMQLVTPEEALNLIPSLVKSKGGVRYIQHFGNDPDNFGAGFVRFHFIPVAKRAEYLARKMGLDPKLVAAAGAVHDWGKIWQPEPGHEVTGAFYVLLRGEELGIVKGGTKAERGEALRVIACMLARHGPPYYEVIPGNMHLHSEAIVQNGIIINDGKYAFARLEPQVEFLRRKLFKDGKVHSLEETLLVQTDEDRALVLGDLVPEIDMERGILIGMYDRFYKLDEPRGIIPRYTDPQNPAYSPIGARVAEIVAPIFMGIQRDVADRFELSVQDRLAA